MSRLRPATGLIAALLLAPLPGFAETITLERATDIRSNAGASARPASLWRRKMWAWPPQPRRLCD